MRNETLEKRLIVPDYTAKLDRKIESYVSNRFIPTGSLTLQEYDESMLLADAHFGNILEDKDNQYNFIAPSYINNIEEDNSLTKSYN
jgi:hypothetical protein